MSLLFFPHAASWLVGTRRPLRLNPAAFERHRAHSETRAALDAAPLIIDAPGQGLR